MASPPTPAERAVAICAVAGEWAPTVTATTTVTDVDEFRPTRTVEVVHWENTTERTKRRTRAPGCSRCDGTGTVRAFNYDTQRYEPRTCPNCKERYDETVERTNSGTERMLDDDYDLASYPDPVERLVRAADPEVQSETPLPGGPEAGDVAHSDDAVAVRQTEAVPCATLEFACDGRSVEGYRVDGAYYLRGQPTLVEPEGLLSRLLDGGPSVAVQRSPLKAVGYEATGRVDCRQCADELVGVVDPDSAVHGVCLGCGRRIDDAGWIDRDRTDEAALGEEVATILERWQGV